MDLSFFDCNAFIGSAQTGTWRPARSGPEFVSIMDETGIDEALLWHVGQQDWSPTDGNSLLSREIAGERRLWGCWTLLPPQTAEVPSAEELFRRMKNERIRAIRLFPDTHRFVASRSALGAILDSLADRGVPLFLSIERGGMNYTSIDALLAEFPRLTCVLCDVGGWGVDRFIRPLLERYDGLRVETSHIALHDGVLPCLVEAYGAERLLFGTGFPDRLPASAMLPLMHAEITDEEKRLIAGGNLHRLLEEVKL